MTTSLTSNEILPNQANKTLYRFRSQHGKFRNTIKDTICKGKNKGNKLQPNLFYQFLIQIVHVTVHT